MGHPTCPHCRGHLVSDEDRCRWCDAWVPQSPPPIKPGDVIRLRNMFKGGRVEEVTVVRVDRGGHGIEFRDTRGQIWGYAQPRDILAVVRRGKTSA